LELGDSDSQWVVWMRAEEVRNGCWYKVGGGDAATPEHRVEVRTVPLLTGFEVTYRYRPYLGWPEQTTRNANLAAHKGTEVTLVARANGRVKDGQLSIDGKKPLDAEIRADDPEAL